jgi:tRNA(Ile)-lysidine synthase
LRCVAVAASGGRDSTALLHCTRQVAGVLGVHVLALHVHHGLNPDADQWWAHVQRQCRRWGVVFAGHRLSTRPAAGESVEAWARRERYAALQAMAEAAGCDLVLLAHHRRDQAETWLLQALRGGGPSGLASMARHTESGDVSWARPWLDMPREAIEAYVRRHRLSYVEDASNADERFARNRLRAKVWPVLTVAFPDAEVALSAAASRAHEAAALSGEVAAIDLPATLQGDGLHITRWMALPEARRLNVLRAWLLRALARGAPQSLVDRLWHELPSIQGKSGRSRQWVAPQAMLRLYRGVLTVTHSAAPAVDSLVGAQQPQNLLIDLSQPGEWPLPSWHGRFVTTVVASGGVAASVLAAVQARARAGGEQFQLSARGTLRSLKKQYQAQGVAAWHRHGPLLFAPQGQLLFAPGLGVNASARAAAGQAQLSIVWLADG